jgi:hypothetical protein
MHTCNKSERSLTQTTNQKVAKRKCTTSKKAA